MANSLYSNLSVKTFNSLLVKPFKSVLYKHTLTTAWFYCDIKSLIAYSVQSPHSIKQYLKIDL